MKANHNMYLSTIDGTNVVINISKIQNESKSQLRKGQGYQTLSCYQYFKDTK